MAMRVVRNTAKLQREEYTRIEALAKIAYDEYHNGLIQTFSAGVDQGIFPTWEDLTPTLREIWAGVAQAVRAGVLRGVA